MMSFSLDAHAADVEMRAVLFILVAFAHIDGNFEASERSFVRSLTDDLIERRANEILGPSAPERADILPRWRAHFYHVIVGMEHEIQTFFTESVAEGESMRQFVVGKLKLRCFELLCHLDANNRAPLLDAVDRLMHADGVAHADEQRFREDLLALLQAPPGHVEAPHSSHRGGPVIIEPMRRLSPHTLDHDFFHAIEQTRATDIPTFLRHAAADMDLMRRFEGAIEAQRARGLGKLNDKHSFTAFAGQDPFLDGHVYVMPAKPGRAYELLVLGDLHGCYSCLKAALLQADFFNKVEAHRRAPHTNPAVFAVFLGDYIDRGRHSYDGILRAVLRLFVAAPDNVFVLRGNHEHYFETQGRVESPVRPAEAIASVASFAPKELLSAYMRLFEVMPNMLAFERTFFVHAGIPREDTLALKFKDLSALNDAEIRLQTCWSDPSDADFIPLDLQRANTRFPFGREQYRAFMRRIGCTTMIRGHERVVEGMRRVYHDPGTLLLSLFSAGGAANPDLPAQSNYREVSPMALLLHHQDGATRITPFPIEYEHFATPEHNGFLR